VEKTFIQARVQFVPETSNQFSRTVAHYVCALVNHIGPVGEGETIDRAVRATGIDTWDHNICVQIEPIAWPADTLEKWMTEQHESALREEKDRDAKRVRDELYARRSAMLAEQMKNWKLFKVDVWVSIDCYDGRITVGGVNRYNTYRHKSETVYKERHYKIDKDGFYNWKKIQEAVEQVAAYKARERNEEQAKRSVEDQSKALLEECKAAGIEGWEANVSGGVSFTVAAYTLEEVKALVEALSAVTSKA